MVKEWPRILIGDVFEFKNGLSKGKEFFGQGTPFISYSDVYKNNSLTAADIRGRVHLTKEEISKLAVQKNDVFFTRTSETPEEVGYSAVLLEDVPDCVFNGFVLRARPKNNWLFPGYCKYCFSTKAVRDDVAKRCKFTTRAGITGRALSEIEIPLPQMSEQKAIAEVLDVLETHIQNLSRLIEKKSGIRNGASNDLLEGKTRLDGFCEDWAKKRIEDLVTRIATGLNPRNNFTLNTGGMNYYVTIKNFTHGHLTLDNECDRVNDDALALIQRRSSLQIDDILFASIGRIGDCYLVKSEPKNWNINESVFSLRPNKQMVYPEYLFHAIHSTAVLKQLNNAETGSTFRSIKKGDLQNVEIWIPSMAEQIAIANTLTAMDEEIEALEAEREKMLQIREGAMDDLLTGRVRLTI